MCKESGVAAIDNLLLSPQKGYHFEIHSQVMMLFFIYLFFPPFYHNKIHPVTNYKAIKNKINKTRQQRTVSFIFLTNKTTTTTKQTKKKQ